MALLQRVYIIEFLSPFSFGWGRPREYIDASSVARALIRVGYHLGIASSVYGALSEGRLIPGPVLPAIRVDGRLEYLVPAPRLPRVGKARFEWSTLSGAQALLEMVAGEGGGLVYESGGRYFLRTSRGDYELKVYELGGEDGARVLAGLGGGVERIDARMGSFVLFYRNALDRVTAASALYHIEGFRPSTPYWMPVCVDEQLADTLDVMLRLLEDLGVGGKRRAGWGRFRIVEVREESLVSCGGGRGYNLLIARHPGVALRGAIDEARSYYELGVAEGFANYHNPLPLPRTLVFEPGSLVYVRSELRPVYIVEGLVDRATCAEPHGCFRVSLPFPLVSLTAG